MTHAVMATPKDQPMVSVVYRLLADINMPRMPPMSTARKVSCGILSPWYTCLNQCASFCSGVASAGRVGMSPRVGAVVGVLVLLV